MSKWVTAYYDIMSGIHDVVVHDNKELATDYFKKHCRQYFQLSSKIEVVLPMTYGYPFRKYIGISKRKFEEQFGVIENKPHDCD